MNSLPAAIAISALPKDGAGYPIAVKIIVAIWAFALIFMLMFPELTWRKMK